MAKYINAETLKNILEAKANMAQGTPKEVFLSVTKMIDALPTADVEDKCLEKKVEVLTCERDYWKEEAWKARKEELEHNCLSDTEVFMRFVQAIEVESSNAIRSNRAVIRERVEKRGADRLTDPICCTCAGKIAALDDIWDFIEDLVKKMTEGGIEYGV